MQKFKWSVTHYCTQTSPDVRWGRPRAPRTLFPPWCDGAQALMTWAPFPLLPLSKFHSPVDWTVFVITDSKRLTVWKINSAIPINYWLPCGHQPCSLTHYHCGFPTSTTQSSPACHPLLGIGKVLSPARMGWTLGSCFWVKTVLPSSSLCIWSRKREALVCLLQKWRDFKLGLWEDFTILCFFYYVF